MLRTYPQCTDYQEMDATESLQRGLTSTQSYDIPISSSFHHSPAAVISSLESGDAMEREAAPTTSGGKERYCIGLKKAKAIRQEGVRTKAVCLMAEFPKRKFDALVEKKAILIFSQPEDVNRLETKAFFAAIQQRSLSRGLQKARVVGDKAKHACNITGSVASSASSLTVSRSTLASASILSPSNMDAVRDNAPTSGHEKRFSNACLWYPPYRRFGNLRRTTAHYSVAWIEKNCLAGWCPA